MSSIEAAMRGAVSEDRLRADLEALVRWERHSGSTDEEGAAQYIAARLRAAGVPVTIYHFPSFLGLPTSAQMTVLDSEPWEIEVVAHSFSASTGSASLESQVVLTGQGTEEDFARAPVVGKLALVQAMPRPEKAWFAQRAGAAGVLFISIDDVIRQSIATTVWGTPTPDSALMIPTIPVVSMKRSDGLRLVEESAAGSVTARVQTDTFIGWKQVPVVIANIAPDPDQDFVLLASHLDSWQTGAMDNASGDVCSMEAARIFWQHRNSMPRGLRVCWWPGHSTGRYSGSTWYADNFWEELDERCVAVVTVDQVGFVGNTRPRIRTFSEFAAFAQAAIKDVTGRDIPEEGVEGNNDQSFWGIGISSLCYGSWDEERERAGLPGPSWFWHSPQDTIDKIVWPRLRQDAEVIMTLVARLTTDPMLPFDFAPVAAQLSRGLRELNPGLHDLPFDAIASKADEVHGLVATLCRQRGLELQPSQKAAVTVCLKDLARILNPVLYTKAGRWEHDPAANRRMLPSLRNAPVLKRLDHESTEARFMRTALRRELNRVADALNRARQRIQETLAEVTI